ncbi:hypothetical protein LINPERHAP2_LOCUS3240, partial [Linum perenne]
TQNSTGGNTTYLLRIWATTKVGKSPPPSRSSACENLLRIWVTTWSENLLRRRGRLLVRTSSGNDEVVCNAEVACNDDRDSEVLRGIGETKQKFDHVSWPQPHRSSWITSFCFSWNGVSLLHGVSTKAGRSKPVIDSSKALPPQATFRGPYVNTGSCDIGPNFKSYPKK